MSSFFRNLNENFTNKRENAIKEAILNALKDNIKSVEEEILLHGRGEIILYLY